MPRWLALTLAPLAISLAVIVLLSSRMMAPGDEHHARGRDTADARKEMELEYVLGMGAPPLMAEVEYVMGMEAPPATRGSRRAKGEEERPRRRSATGDHPQSALVDEDAESEEQSPGSAEEEETQLAGVDGGQAAQKDAEEDKTTAAEEPEEDDEEEEEEDGSENGEAEDDDYDPARPRKDPKGKRWKGWSKNRKVNDNANANKGRGGNGGKQQSSPRNTGNDWWRKSPLCFEVDYICHGQGTNEWFYYTPPSSSKGNEQLFQPTMELKSAPAKYDGGKDRGETRISIKVASSSKLTPEDMRFEDGSRAFLRNTQGGDGGKARCHISSAPTHIVLQSLFNDMIGEFYSRTLLRLYNFMTEGLDGRTNEGKLPWEEKIQFYVHIPYGNKKMLDGHTLLLSGMLSDPDSPTAKSLVDLFPSMRDKASDGSSKDCHCYEKMVFCGYDVYTHPSNVKSKDLESANDDDFDGDGAEESDDATAVSPAIDYDLKYTLWSAGKLDHSAELDHGSCGRGTGGSGTEYVCQEWKGLRNFLSANFEKHYPSLDRDIQKHRREQLLKVGSIDKDYKGDTKEFTVIGLTQRTYRRAWLNLPAIIKACNAASFERVACVEVNVENTSTPFEQLPLHRSLDVMIGVHGAQMTQAILLPKHAHVLELLPWITDYIRGKWVQTTHGPTPLGVIFHNTDLNHAGFSLDRSSVPLCEGVNKEALQTCFMSQRKKFIWENRDFTVDSAAILQYIEKFVLFVKDKQRPCEELKGSLDERFVLYNVWCTKPKYWHPTMLADGSKACVYGADYPVDHTNKLHIGMSLFDSKEACSAAFAGAEPIEESSGDDFLVFHAYHEPPKQQTQNVLARVGKGQKRGKKERIRKREEE